MRKYKEVKMQKKRILAFVLAVLLAATTIPTDYAVYAAESDISTQEAEPVTEEAEGSAILEEPAEKENVLGEQPIENTSSENSFSEKTPVENQVSEKEISKKDTAEQSDLENQEATKRDSEKVQTEETQEETQKKEETSFLSAIKKTLTAASSGEDLQDLSEVVDSIKLSTKKYTYTSQECRPTVTLTDYNDKVISASNYKVTYTNNINAGTATVTVTGKEEKGYTGEKKTTFRILARDISTCDVEPLTSPVIYTSGVDYKPEVVLTYGGYTLVPGTDYRVTYQNYNKVGTETILITGAGNFTSTREEYVTLIGDFEKDAEVVIDGNAADYNTDFATEYTTRYTGKTVDDPIVEVMLAGSSLVEDTDFIVDYTYQSDRTNVGVVKIKINGIGTYAGKSIIASYEIVPRPLTGCVLTLTSDTKSYTGNPITFDPSDVTLQRNGTTLEYGESKDYVLEYENNTNAGTAIVKAVGRGNYTGSVEKEFTILTKDITALEEVTIVGVSDRVYTGNEITFPDAKITYKSGGQTKELAPENYTFSYTSNKEIGTATLLASGRGNLSGTISTTFRILPKTFEGLTFTVGGSTITCTALDYDDTISAYVMYSDYTVVYNGSVQEPDIVIKEGSTNLAWKGVTYTIEDNTDAGWAYVDVSGSAPYTDQKAKVYFKITPKAFSDKTTVSAITPQAYTGTQVCPEPIVKDGNKTLVKDLDYELTYKNNIMAAPMNATNPPTVTVTGIGNYSGTKTLTYTIGSDLSQTTTAMNTDHTVLAVDSYQVPYLGTFRPDFSLFTGVSEVDASNYDVTYSPNTTAANGTTVTVTCIGKKGYYGTRTLSYTVEQADIGKVAISNKDNGGSFNYTYSARQIGVNLEVSLAVGGDSYLLTKGTDYYITGENLNGNNLDGTVGTHEIAINGMGNFKGSQTVTYTVEKGDISTDRYQVSAIDSQIYTGSPIKPKVVITDKETSRQLELDKDFEITGYENNTAIGESATIHVTGINSYKGSRDITFSIIRRNLEQGDVTIDAIENQIYTGNPIEPNTFLTVYYEGNPISSTDYEVTFSNNINIGYANVTITGKNNYQGTRTFLRAFKIVGNLADTNRFTIEGVDAHYILNNDGTIDTSKITVKYYGQDVQVDPSNYEIVKVNCTAPGTRQIRVEGKNGCYGSMTFNTSVLCSLDVTSTLITVKNIESSYDYTGGPIKPVPTVIFKGEDALQKGVHYQVEYGDNTEAGVGTVRIYAIGTYYVAERTIPFSINYNLSNASVSGVEASYEFDGSPVTPLPVVTCRGKTLTRGIDYDVTYSQNAAAGKAKMTITPHEGAYVIGSREIAYDITKASLADATITYDGKNQSTIDTKAYIAEEIKPEVKVVHHGTELVAGTDYTVEYVNNKHAADKDADKAPTVIVKGQGNYSGTITKTFTIEPWNISSDVVMEIENGFYAGGEAVTPGVQLIYRGMTLTEGENADYTVTYSNNTQVGENAAVTIVGKNNFAGTVKKTFSVQKTNLGAGYLDITQDTMTYDGTEKTLVSIKKAMTVVCPIGGGKTHTLTDGEFDISCDRTIRAAGSYTLVIEGKNGFYGTLETEFVVEPKTITDSFIVVDDIPGQTYTGAAVKPTVVIKDGGKDLVENEDFSVQYVNNISAGKATVIITGLKNYTGSREEYFYIGESIEGKCTISLKDSRIIYNGTQQIPGINTVTYDGNTALVQDLDYVIATKDETGRIYDYTNAGRKNLYIKGTGKYYGESMVEYEIEPKIAQPEKISATLNLTRPEGEYTTTYTGQPIKPTVTVYDQEISASRPLDEADYIVEYVNNTNVGTADVRIRLTRNYQSGTEKLLQFKITKKSLEDYEISLDMTRIHYTGKQITPAVVVRDAKGGKLEEKEYIVTYANNTNAGLATVIVTAKDDGNFQGQLTKEFIIYASLADKQDTQIKGVETQFYMEGMEEEPKPVPEIICGGNRLVIGEDVEVTYNYVNGNTSRGSVSIVSKKHDFYLDSVTLEYDIGVDTSVLDISGYANEYTYTGQAVCPKFVVKTPNGKVLSYDATKVTYTNKNGSTTTVGDCVNAGEITATIPLIIGDKQVPVQVNYRIVKKQIASCKLVQLVNNTYTGKKLTPPVTILYNNKQLVSGRDYTVSYKNNTNPGVASVVVVGKGNYTGTTTLHFNILAANMIKLNAKAASTSSIRLNWSKGSKVTGYQIYSSNGKTKYGTTSKSTYTVKKLKAGTSYKFKVRTYVKVGGKTTYGKFQTVTSCTKVAKVNINASSTAKKTIELSWSKNQTVGGYEIYRATSKNGKYKKIASIPNTKTGYTDKKRTSGKTYYYKVRAYKKVNGSYLYGSFSAKVKATAK